MIPDFVDDGGPWKVLPPGIHDATLAEVRERLAKTPRRKALYRGIAQACRDLQAAGCTVAYLDGSFGSDKPIPGDFDMCWDPAGVDPHKLDPVLLDFDNGRANQKAKYLGELFPSSSRADGTATFLDYFQIDKLTGTPKGIICLHLPKERVGRKHDHKRETV